MAHRMAKRAVTWLQPRLPGSTKRVAARAGKLAGYDYSYPSLPASLRTFASWGYRPRFVVDVGAYVGEWTTAFRTFFPDCRVLMVEPQEAKFDALQKVCEVNPGVRLASALLNDVEGLVDFYEMEQGSSMMAEMTAFPRKALRKPAVRLDDLLAAHSDRGAPDFLKLDVQGAELKVLRGATTALAAAEFVLLETAFKPYNEGAPLVGEVIQFMADHAYSPIDIWGEHRGPSGGLYQVDLLFINDASASVENWRALNLAHLRHRA